MSDKFIGKWAFPLNDSLLEQSARRGDQYDFKKIADDIVKKIHFEQDDVVLDVCCGNAALAITVSKICREIHGVDYSEILIDSAKKVKAKNNLTNLQLHLSDALNIDKLFSENFFDKAYCYFSFQYFNRNKREALLDKLSYVTRNKGTIFLGDIPDKTRKWNFYKSPQKFYREKISRFLKFKEGECDLGWWIDPQEIRDWCTDRNMRAEVLLQGKNLPHSHYRFDVLINNTK